MASVDGAAHASLNHPQPPSISAPRPGSAVMSRVRFAMPAGQRSTPGGSALQRTTPPDDSCAGSRPLSEMWLATRQGNGPPDRAHRRIRVQHDVIPNAAGREAPEGSPTHSRGHEGRRTSHLRNPRRPQPHQVAPFCPTMGALHAHSKRPPPRPPVSHRTGEARRARSATEDGYAARSDVTDVTRQPGKTGSRAENRLPVGRRGSLGFAVHGVGEE